MAKDPYVHRKHRASYQRPKPKPVKEFEPTEDGQKTRHIKTTPHNDKIKYIKRGSKNRKP